MLLTRVFFAVCFRVPSDRIISPPACCTCHSPCVVDSYSPTGGRGGGGSAAFGFNPLEHGAGAASAGAGTGSGGLGGGAAAGAASGLAKDLGGSSSSWWSAVIVAKNKTLECCVEPFVQVKASSLVPFLFVFLFLSSFTFSLFVAAVAWVYPPPLGFVLRHGYLRVQALIDVPRRRDGLRRQAASGSREQVKKA